MEAIITHEQAGVRIAELVTEGLVITDVETGMDLLGNLYYTDVDRLIIHQHQLTPAFFELRSGIAGELLQKFTNYRMRLAIVGDFSQYDSKSLKDFIFESNKGKQVNFVNTLEEALSRLAGN